MNNWNGCLASCFASVTASPMPARFTFVWQGADLDALGGWHLSNPSASYVF
jgi:hypothetical protein